MRPLSEIASRIASGAPLQPGATAALRFFSEALRRGLPPRRIVAYGALSGPAFRTYTDAMYEKGKLSGILWRTAPFRV
jgi:hypothetical protein